MHCSRTAQRKRCGHQVRWLASIMHNNIWQVLKRLKFEHFGFTAFRVNEERRNWHLVFKRSNWIIKDVYIIYSDSIVNVKEDSLCYIMIYAAERSSSAMCNHFFTPWALCSVLRLLQGKLPIICKTSVPKEGTKLLPGFISHNNLRAGEVLLNWPVCK